MDQAIDPKTGEINWDCPCMGNNAKGPCAELFKQAFRCFIKNQDTPEKCMTHIQNMQKCQNKYPNIYAENDNK